MLCRHDTDKVTRFPITRLREYIVRLIEDGNKAEYLPWLRKNINRGWENRDKARGLTGKDYGRKVTAAEVLSCYDASGIPALMLVCPPTR